MVESTQSDSALCVGVDDASKKDETNKSISQYTCSKPKNDTSVKSSS